MRPWRVCKQVLITCPLLIWSGCSDVETDPIQEAKDATVEASHSVGNAVRESVNDTAEAVEDLANEVSDVVEDTMNDAAGVVKEMAESVEDAVTPVETD